uniref:Integrase, catalytic region, zinc finger, CCHC-type, peptidase aspartic, catalytic n=1 Tax=Tanacetum cinerariifolium TaxID=118510 RepID=A0A699HMB0_TANCI|nr:integrase, catalytic region, zinc finger, CCHC-type, peptidase aspartic, catalytic [Tanacetum cinerariifolium]
MTNLSKDIQYAGSDTRPPMLDRNDFASWQQRIRLYCRGKKNGVNILKSIDKGPFQMGILRETLTEGTEGALHLGPEQPQVYSNLTYEEKDRYNADIRATYIILQGLPKDIHSLINHYTDAKDIWDNVKMLLEGSELTKEDHESQLYDDFEHFRQYKGETFSKLINDMRNIKMTMSRMQLNSKFVNNMLLEWGRFVTAVKLNKGLRNSNYDQLYAYLKQHEGRQIRGQGNNARGAGAAGYGGAQNRVGYANPGQARQIKCYNCNGGQDNVVDGDVDEQPVQDLALNVDNVFQADNCNAFDSNVDEAPTAQTMFMANISFADPVYDEANSSYDSDVLSEVHDHDHYQDVVCEHHEVHEMHDDVQPNYVVDSHTDYTSDSNMTPYDQYVKDNAVQVEQSDVSAVSNDAYMMILNDMHEPPTQHVYVTTHTKVVDKSLTAELATYKEQVELYERWPRFELAKNEQKIDEQLRIDSVTPKVLAPGMYAIDVEPIPPCLRNNKEVHLDYLKHLKESVAIVYEIVKEAKVERPLDRSVASACLYTKHSEELLEYKTNVPVLPSTGVDSCTDASGSKPRSNTKKNRISPAKSVNKKTVKDHFRTNKSHLQKPNRVDSSTSSKRTVINSNSNSVCQTCCSKHMTGDRSRLRNFMKKFIGTIRFRNDHFGAIIGYGDYVIGSRGSNMYTISVEDMMKSSQSACCPKPPRPNHGCGIIV